MQGIFKTSDQYKLLTCSDWNVLIILDAFRGDVKEYTDLLHTIELEPRPISSMAQHTYYYTRALYEIYKGRYLYYVNANPIVNKALLDLNKDGNPIPPWDFLNVWPESWKEFDADPVILPTDVLAKVEPFFNNQPKHLVIHLLQPHAPYIGNERLSSLVRDYDMLQKDVRLFELLRDAYKKNIEVVLPVLRTLLDSLEGRIIVTSDHGECLGDGGFYGHRPCLTEPCLGCVPWATQGSFANLPLILKGVAGDVITEDLAKARLRSLGYTEEELSD